MDTQMLLQLLLPAAALLIGHLQILPKLIQLLAPKAQVPALPTTFGHGELIAWLAKLAAQHQATPAANGTPAAPSAHPELTQILLLLQQMAVQLAQAATQATPAAQAATPAAPAKVG